MRRPPPTHPRDSGWQVVRAFEGYDRGDPFDPRAVSSIRFWWLRAHGYVGSFVRGIKVVVR